jgi:hypothetical protein
MLSGSRRIVLAKPLIPHSQRGMMSLADAYKKYDEKKPEIVKGITYAGGGVMMLGATR